MATTEHQWPTPMITPDQITLGILAGGRATRLGGADKAWLQRDGIDQATRWRDRFAGEVGPMLISANRQLERCALAGLEPVPDRLAGNPGPLAGLDALADACRTPWLLTIPVDLVEIEPHLLAGLIGAANADGACARDDDGLQPLIALWRVAALRAAVAAALAAGELAVQALHRRLDFAQVHFPGLRFGNLNTPADLSAAGFPLE